MNKIIIITGPCGVGKTSIATLVAETYKYEYLSGDALKKKLFPDIPRITEHPEKLQQIRNELFNQAKQLFDAGKNVVIDYIFTDKNELQKYFDMSCGTLSIFILLPPVETIIQRDKSRSCWSAGSEIITQLYEKFAQLRKTNLPIYYIDNSEGLPVETLKKYFL